ncbi:MAG: glycosyltransferase family 39 protein [Acidimicrobiales bacterium]
MTPTPSETRPSSGSEADAGRPGGAGPGRGSDPAGGPSNASDGGPSNASAGGPSNDSDGPAETVSHAVDDGAGVDAEDVAGTAAAPIEIVVLALVAAVLGIGMRFVTRSPLWLDEALSVNIAQLPPGEIVQALRQDGHPPLYYLLLHGWTAAFGTSDAAVRSLSAVIGIASLPLAWLVGRRRGGPLLAWILVAVVALSPYAVRYSTETRMYSMVITLVLAGYLLVDDVVRRGRDGVGRLVGLALVAGALLLSHYWSLWLLGSLGIVLLVTWRRSSDPARRRGAGRAVLALVAGGILLFAWWLPAMLYQSAHTGTPWASADRPTVSVSAALADFAAGAIPDAPMIVIASTLVFALGVFGVAVDRRHIQLDVRTARRFRVEVVVLVLTFGVGLAINIVSRSAFQSRYGAVFFPFYALVVAGGLLCFRSRPIRAGVLAGLLVLYSVAVVFNGFITQRSQSRSAAEAIRAEASPGDVVVVCPDQLGPSFSRELGDDFTYVVYPRGGTPQRVDWVDYAKRNADSADPARVQAFADDVLRTAGDRGIAVIWSGTYKTLDGQCEQLLGDLGAVRPGRGIVDSQPEKYYEPANVTWYPPVRR